MSLQKFASRVFALAALLALLFAGRADAEGNAPVVITSDTLVADTSGGTAVFEGSVVASSDGMTLAAERMTVYYDDERRLERIEAEGSVRLVAGGRVLTSEHAVYRTSEGTVVFTGRPRAVEDGNILVGTRIVYMVKDDRFEVEGSKVFIDSLPEPGGAGGQ
jgi:lipopolysaccharide export system protein LptA